MHEFLTPADLSRELGVDPRAIRGYLREQHGTLVRTVTRWWLTDGQAAGVRARFRGVQ